MNCNSHLKILIVHNDYGRYSGEEAVVDSMGRMFADRGHEVAFYRCSTAGRRNKLGDELSAFFSGVCSPSGIKGMREALLHERPDVVNVHNLFPFISPAALFECRKEGVPVVMTVHNYRLMCPTGLFMRRGRPCEQCLSRGNEWGCVWHNCEQSVPKSVAYALRNAVARRSGAYRKCVDRYACLTHFQRQKLIEAGFEAERITVIPNSVEVNADTEPATGHYVGYLGRLSYEKGYDMLLEVARRQPNVEFRFAGTLREDGVEPLPSNVRFMGYLRGHSLQQFIHDSRFMVMPSRCYEGFPMAILEAARQMKPVVAPRHGAFTEIVGQGSEAIGRLFEPGQVDSLQREVMALWDSRQLVADLGSKAYSRVKQEYSTDSVLSKWEMLLSSL